MERLGHKNAAKSVADLARTTSVLRSLIKKVRLRQLPASYKSYTIVESVSNGPRPRRPPKRPLSQVGWCLKTPDRRANSALKLL